MIRWELLYLNNIFTDFKSNLKSSTLLSIAIEVYTNISLAREMIVVIRFFFCAILFCDSWICLPRKYYIHVWFGLNYLFYDQFSNFCVTPYDHFLSAYVFFLFLQSMACHETFAEISWFKIVAKIILTFVDM